jgi:hypothetical protein
MFSSTKKVTTNVPLSVTHNDPGNKFLESPIASSPPSIAWSNVHYIEGVSWALEGSLISIMRLSSTSIEPKSLASMYLVVGCVINLIFTIHAYLVSGHLRSLLFQSTAKQLFKKPLL